MIWLKTQQDYFPTQWYWATRHWATETLGNKTLGNKTLASGVGQRDFGHQRGCETGHWAPGRWATKTLGNCRPKSCFPTSLLPNVSVAQRLCYPTSCCPKSCCPTSLNDFSPNSNPMTAYMWNLSRVMSWVMTSSRLWNDKFAFKLRPDWVIVLSGRHTW